MKPQVVAWELGKRLRDDAIVSCDSGPLPLGGLDRFPLAGTDSFCLRQSRIYGVRLVLHNCSTRSESKPPMCSFRG